MNIRTIRHLRLPAIALLGIPITIWLTGLAASWTGNPWHRTAFAITVITFVPVCLTIMIRTELWIKRIDTGKRSRRERTTREEPDISCRIAAAGIIAGITLGAALLAALIILTIHMTANATGLDRKTSLWILAYCGIWGPLMATTVDTWARSLKHLVWDMTGMEIARQRQARKARE